MSHAIRKTLSFLLTVLGGLHGSADLHAQGTTKLSNNSASAISNGLTGARVVVGTTFRAAIYGAPDGTTDENLLVAFGATTIIAPAAGLVAGGTRTAPMVLPQAWGIFQYRAWETAYGSTYEQAAAAPPMNGRRALVGRSNLVRVQTGDPFNNIPPGSPTAFGLQGFTLTPSSGSLLSINNLVVSETTNGTREARFTVTLQLPQAETVSVDFATVDGTALAGSDYVATNGTLVFSPGETTQTVTVLLTADMPPEPDEDFFLRLSNPINASIAAAQARCVITEVRIEDIAIDAVVEFHTVAQSHYVLEKSDDQIHWSVVEGAEDILGTGGIVTVYDRGGGLHVGRTYRPRLRP